MAIVFVPEGKLQAFERRLTEYLDQNKLTKTGRRHEALVNSITRIRRTVLEDLWTDPVRLFPVSQGPLWWEVWVRNSAGLDRFRAHASRLGIEVGRQSLPFPDRTVILARATTEEMTLSVQLLDSIAELREARSVACELLELSHSEEAQRVDDLRLRTTPPPEDCPVVCILDTGVDVGHPLLENGLYSEDAHSYDRENWGIDDHHGHGTEMAGFALYGEDLDRHLLSAEPIQLRHRIESVKILPRTGSNPPDLYGEILLAAAARVETFNRYRSRAYSLSVTDQSCPAGRPTSWSAAVDQLCAGAEEENAPARLSFVSSGNADTQSAGYVYPATNYTDCIQDPAQAWNAVTVGAYTEKTIIHEENYRDWAVVAALGDMSPCNTTSVSWPRRDPWPNKPDLVFEGGNMALDPVSGQPDSLESLSLLTTKRRVDSRRLCWSGNTSAATAATARMGALVAADYPDLWPETARALLVHSGRWTPAMLAQFADRPRRERMGNLLRCYGYGVPDLDRALYSLSHQLTLVVQDTLQPFKIENGKAKPNEMRLHRIPWPSDVLAGLGATSIRMRVTLSYFIEPSPGRFTRRYRYASHGLRYKTKTASEREGEFLARINRAMREEDEAPTTGSDSSEWLLGPHARDRGSIHSDVWEGTAADLASKDQIAIYPVLGWWRNPKRPDRCLRQTQYALVVSLESDSSEVEIDGVMQPVDFYTPVLNEISTSTEIELL